MSEAVVSAPRPPSGKRRRRLLLQDDSFIALAEQPMRAELFSVDQLEQHAKALAGWHRVEDRRGKTTLLRRLDDNEAILIASYRLISSAAEDGRPIPPAAEWLLDNFYLIEEQIRTARRHLPRKYNRQLPRLATGSSAGLPRVYDLALELIAHVDGRLDEPALRAFIAAYQTVTTLKLGELWAIPIMLRLALLENLRRVASRVAAGRRESDRANHWADQLLQVAEKDQNQLILVVAELVKENPPLTRAFVAEFTRRLQGQSPSMVFPLTWLEQRLAETGVTSEQFVQQETHAQAADQVSIGNSINSLRFLGAIKWPDFVESMSAVETAFRADPADVYAKMDFGTRDRYRHVVERLARLANLPEEEVAQGAVDLARAGLSHNGHDDRGLHVGYYLIDKGRVELERAIHLRRSFRANGARMLSEHALIPYVGGILLFTLLAGAGAVAVINHPRAWLFCLLAIPLFIAMTHAGIILVNWLSTLFLAPQRLPRLDYEKGIPTTDRTLVVVPCMLTATETIERLLEALEVYHLANRDPNLHFGLLTDFADAAEEQMPQDEELLRQASEGIQRLNQRHAHQRDDLFYLFHRPRRWNNQEGVWMGWERKRGKLTELNGLLRGRGRDRFSLVVGNEAKLPQMRYVITLDADTQLPRNSARDLIGTMAHPLNRPAVDETKGTISQGYAILQPRVEATLPSTIRSRFARLQTGEPGLDPYTRMVSNVYQDAFAEGSFIGKGIYDVDAYERVCGRAFPENRILSHDLLESAYARSGLVSDILLLEDSPSSYAVDASRRHRWIRGDWQILPWIFRSAPGPDGAMSRNPISLLSRWKILDNLRRSLVPVCLLLLVLAGLAAHLTEFTLFLLAIFVVTPVLHGLTQLARKSTDLPWKLHLQRSSQSIQREFLQAGLELCQLPFDAWLNADAIVRTAHRVMRTRRKLLEWQTASETERTAHSSLSGYYRSMWIAPVAALAALLAGTHGSLAIASIAAFLSAAWFIAPGLAWFLSRPLVVGLSEPSAGQRRLLHRIARRTWRYFETFVVSADNYLPPDNFQEHPSHVIAHRTSPTNIGVSLLSNLAAFDLGYLSVGQLLERTGLTLESVERLPRFREQFYNWYDTRTLQPLNPHYVSSVDSGNLAACLLTLRAGLLELKDQPFMPDHLFKGLQDTLQIVLDEARGSNKRIFGQTSPPLSQEALAPLERLFSELGRVPPTLAAIHATMQRTIATATQFAATQDASPNNELKWWSRAFERHARESLEQILAMAPWVTLPPPTEIMWRRGSSEQIRRLAELREVLGTFDKTPALTQLEEREAQMLPMIESIRQDLALQGSGAPSEELDWFARLSTALTQAADRAARRLTDIDRLAERCEDLADLNYDFLYDESRNLLAIGYNVTDHRRDNSFYDLLASEARIATYVAIAQGKLPQDAWFALGRGLTLSGSEVALLSWSGSMFEYLMPLIMMPTYPDTLLDATYQGVVRRQIEYGRQRGVPWGISESGYATTDLELNYQYRAFGVPGLGLKRGLAEDLVVAPYASVLAAMIDPESASETLEQMVSSGYLSDYGLYEALDFTPSRARRDGRPTVVRSWMAHHEGMSLLALDYVLRDRPMQRRFLSDPQFRATELLLQERVPQSAPIFPHATEATLFRRSPAEGKGSPLRVFTTPNTPSPEVHLLSNGRYHLMITAAGGGYSRWLDLALTRWHEDPTRDNWGTFCYVRERATNEFWSTTHQPTLKRGRPYEAVFTQARAEFRRRDHDIDIHTEITVSPEDDIELRRLSITNRSRYRRSIELTSYAEVVLATPAADAAHPVFSNLFVQTEIIRTRQAILCTRRPRSERERPPWMFHLMVTQGETSGDASYETDRAQFVGRGRTLASPQAMYADQLTDSQGAVLDPIVSIRRTLILEPDQVVHVHIVNGAAETRDAALTLIEKYHETRLAERVFELAWTHSQVVLRQLDVTAAGSVSTTEADAQLYSRLASAVIYANPTLRAKGNTIARNRRGQSGLWGYGISGDLPIVLLRIGKISEINLVRQMVQAHAYWRLKGMPVDLVIWNEDQSGYRQDLHDRILGLIASGTEAQRLDKAGGIFVRRSDQISEEDRLLLQAVARAIITDTGGSLAEQLDRRSRLDVRVARFSPLHTHRKALPVGTAVTKRDLACFNGLGGFTKDGREYIITSYENRRTPAPWSNVIANPQFGAVVTESGGGYTWCENAHELRITPWYNDPVTDASGEAFYVRDEESGRFWSPTPLPARGSMPYTTRHGFGYSVFEYSEDGISTELTTYVATDAPVRFWRFRVRNVSGRMRSLSLTGFIEWCMGEHRAKGLMHVVTEIDPESSAILARNAYNTEFGDRIAFFDVSEAQRSVTGNRGEFIGRNGHLSNPAAMEHTHLSGSTGAGLDACGVIQVGIELAENQEREITFIMGCAKSVEEARDLIHQYKGNGPSFKALEKVWEFWKHTLGAVQIETPDASINYLVNGWLLYQVLSCRMWGRSGFYQSGGAYGFRDQLQDSLALMHAQPALIREHILRCAAHQFRQGDVQHWWHPPGGRGVRTRFSDDYLWLPYVVARYVDATGDTGILEERVPFLEGRALNADEESYYDLPARSDDVGSIYDHCTRAINYGLKFGAHGLPLMGCGDWNDGMNLVGIHGKGESVWLAFFLYDVLMRFTELAEDRGEDDMAGIWKDQAQRLRSNIEQHGWDGQWYRRAYFDNGDPLGSASNAECQIDALPQAWAILSNAADPQRCQTALEEVDGRLVRRNAKLIQLFDPPFDTSPLNPGYIKGYPPGVRENGAQYTHAAAWTAMSFAVGGQIDRAWELLSLINPVNHATTERNAGVYAVEPYVACADVYTNPQHLGRGGWTWYTGSAGWLYRLVVESLLGVDLQVDQLVVKPLLPTGWKSVAVHYRYRATLYHIHVTRHGSSNRVARVSIDDQDRPELTIQLIDDQHEHHVKIELRDEA